MRASVRYMRYFHDRGNAKAALRRARTWLTATTARLPPPQRIHRYDRRSRTGIVGVNLWVQRTRRGTLLRYYAATWCDETGFQHRRTFSTAKYGEARARALAVAVRREAVAAILQPAAERGRRAPARSRPRRR